MNTISANNQTYIPALQNIQTTTNTIQEANNTKTAKIAEETKFTTPTKWGFKVDSEGFFGSDFNVAANIPSTIKIHQNMMDQAQKYLNVTGNSLDPMAAISKSWKTFKAVAGSTLDPNGTGIMSEAQAQAMPDTFVTKGDFLDPLVSVQRTNEEVNKILIFNQDVESLSNDNFYTGVKFFNILTIENCKEAIKLNTGTVYDKDLPNDQLAVGEIFSKFVFDQTNLYCVEVQLSTIQKTKDFHAFLESGESMRSYTSRTQGKAFLDDYAYNLGKMPDGSFDPTMIDKLFSELDASMKEMREQIKNLPEIKLVKEEERSSSRKDSEGYQSSSNTKLPAGSLISVGA